jgi:hypothetical protein
MENSALRTRKVNQNAFKFIINKALCEFPNFGLAHSNWHGSCIYPGVLWH